MNYNQVISNFVWLFDLVEVLDITGIKNNTKQMSYKGKPCMIDPSMTMAHPRCGGGHPVCIQREQETFCQLWIPQANCWTGLHLPTTFPTWLRRVSCLIISNSVLTNSDFYVKIFGCGKKLPLNTFLYWFHLKFPWPVVLKLAPAKVPGGYGWGHLGSWLTCEHL